MEADQRTLFLHARRFERDLNERQRAVLARLARGETNAQIADAYGMTFDGAKWNVSEILSKLGLSSREEAADYWRWRQSAKTRVSEMVRALVPVGMPARLMAVSGVMGVGVVATLYVAWLVGISRGNPPPIDVNVPFVLETRSDIVWPDGTVSTTFKRLEWQDSSHWRQTTDEPDDFRGRVVVNTVRDGAFEWRDQINAENVNRNTLASEQTTGDPPLFGSIGPAPADSIEASWLTC